MSTEHTTYDPRGVHTAIHPQRYFFRDLDHNENLEEGLSFHAAGIVDSFHDSPPDKEVCVCFIHPFRLCVETEWRRYSDIEMFPVSELEWLDACDRLSGHDKP